MVKKKEINDLLSFYIKSAPSSSERQSNFLIDKYK